LAQTIVRICFEAGNWRALNDHLVLLSKRRAQLVKVVKAIVVDAMALLDKCPTVELKLELINTLRAISDGKIFVELERANLTMMLAKMKESEGKIAEAADILGEVAVETIGSMELKERAEFLLEQLRLVLDKKDFLRAELISKKINKRQFVNVEWQKIRLQYHQLMIRYNSFTDNYFEICKSWVEIFRIASSPVEKQGEAKDLIPDAVSFWKNALKQSVFYLLLSPWDSELSDLIFRIRSEKLLNDLTETPYVKDLVVQFTTQEIIRKSLTISTK
jgi:26S proteasome regulatory subunit N5